MPQLVPSRQPGIPKNKKNFYMLQPANKSDRMCHLVAMTMRGLHDMGADLCLQELHVLQEVQTGKGSSAGHD